MPTGTRTRTQAAAPAAAVVQDPQVVENIMNAGPPPPQQTWLDRLRDDIPPEYIKQREGWRDRNGDIQYVDYVEWHTVADILDEELKDAWHFVIKNITQIGDNVVVVGTLSITTEEGVVTREGIGCGDAYKEMGIKGAASDALKRAAVMFGVARSLYQDDVDPVTPAAPPQVQAPMVTPGPPPQTGGYGGPPQRQTGPVGGISASPKQIGMIMALAREQGMDAGQECVRAMGCQLDSLSKSAASDFIKHLQAGQRR